MKLLLEKELPRTNYNCGKSGKKVYALSTDDGVDIYSQIENKLLFSFINFQGIVDLFFSFDERFLIGINKNFQFYCFDLSKKDHVSTFIDFPVNFGEILSVTTSIDKYELIILYSKDNDKRTSRLVRFSIPSFKIISDIELDNFYFIIRKSEHFNHYYLSGFLNSIIYFDTNYNNQGRISFGNDLISIKGCFSLDNPKRLFITDLRKLYILNSKYEIFDEITLIDQKEFLEKFKMPVDVLELSKEEDVDIIVTSELAYSSGLYKEKYLVSILNNINMTNQKIRINDISTSERIFDLKIVSRISTILLLPDNILISGKSGTYLFKEDEEKSELLISNPKNSSLGFIHKERLINERINNTT